QRRKLPNLVRSLRGDCILRGDSTPRRSTGVWAYRGALGEGAAHEPEVRNAGSPDVELPEQLWHQCSLQVCHRDAEKGRCPACGAGFEEYPVARQVIAKPQEVQPELRIGPV